MEWFVVILGILLLVTVSKILFVLDNIARVLDRAYPYRSLDYSEKEAL